MASPTMEMDAIGIKIRHAHGETKTVLEAEKDWAYSPISLRWSADGDRLLFSADKRARAPLCALSVAAALAAKAGDRGAAIEFLHEDGSSAVCGEFVRGSAGGNNGRLLFSKQSLLSPPELFSCSSSSSSGGGAGSAVRQLTHFNREKLGGLDLGEPEEVFYEGAKGEEVQAWLIKPSGWGADQGNNKEKSGGYPLAVVVHGGPQGSTGDAWQYRWNLQSYASQGFAVLAPNFHGSTGFGHAFCREISGNWEVGGLDTLAGVRHVLGHPEHGGSLDPKRVVALGASYGGYAMNWLNGNAPEDMFRALVCHCGVYDLKSSYCSTEELFFMETEFGGRPTRASAPTERARRARRRPTRSSRRAPGRTSGRRRLCDPRR